MHHLAITDAKLHFHERTDEIYYVIGGQGRMQLDGSEIELREGMVVTRRAASSIRRGVI